MTSCLVLRTLVRSLAILAFFPGVFKYLLFMWLDISVSTRFCHREKIVRRFGLYCLQLSHLTEWPMSVHFADRTVWEKLIPFN